MIVCLFGAAVGALISAVWDDGDEDANEVTYEKIPSLTDDEYFGWLNMIKLDIIEIIMSANASMTFNQAVMIAEEVYKIHGNNRNMMEQEAYRIMRVIDEDGFYYASEAEKQYVRVNFLRINYIDDQVQIKPLRIYDSIDPADDGDFESGDAFDFETEIENTFGVEQMAISEEDIQAEMDIRDPSSVDPIDQITQDEEISVSDTTTGVDSEVSQTEEVFFQEEVIYPNVGDDDLDPTNDNDELFIPQEEFRYEEEIEAKIGLMEQVIDDAEEFLNANRFEAMAGTFYQDESEQNAMWDDTYYMIDPVNNNIVDFGNRLDDTAAIPTDFVDDRMGVEFFQWIEESTPEILDIDPNPGFMSPYGIIGGFV